jgi:membrane protein involved in colicin uptake
MTEQTTVPVPEPETTSLSPKVAGTVPRTAGLTKWSLLAAALIVGFVLGFIVQAPRVTAGFNAGLERDRLKAQLATVTTERDEMAKQLDPIHKAAAAQQEADLAAAKAKADADAKAAAEAAAATAAAAAAAKANTFGDGIYLVGTDLPAGKYKGTPSGGTSAYWQISSDANGRAIIANNNVDGQFYIEVKAGQYLEIARAQITRVQ